jgi:hypothetical protein
MNEKNNTHKISKQNLMMRWLKTVGEKLFNWLCQYEMGIASFESQAFLFHSGLGIEEAALYQSFAHTKRIDA